MLKPNNSLPQKSNKSCSWTLQHPFFMLEHSLGCDVNRAILVKHLNAVRNLSCQC